MTNRTGSLWFLVHLACLLAARLSPLASTELLGSVVFIHKTLFS